MRKPQAIGTRFKSVLLIDDNEIDNFINERIITSTNFATEVVVRDSGPSALEYLKKVLANREEMPELIFLDLNMPLMDGFTFLEEYDSIISGYNEHNDTQIRVIVLSSSISPTDIDKASTNPHVYKYLNKPLSEKYLEAIVMH